MRSCSRTEFGGADGSLHLRPIASAAGLGRDHEGGAIGVLVLEAASVLEAVLVLEWASVREAVLVPEWASVLEAVLVPEWASVLEAT